MIYQGPLPDKKYKIIYADPCWKYQTWSEKGEGRSASQHYKVMKTEDLKQIPVGDIAAKDSVLFCWVTDPMLIEQLGVIKHWGFTYKTVGFTWIKQNKKSDSLFMGGGYYTRSNPEMCLIATKGSPGRVKDRGVRQVLTTRIREHSRKPDEVYPLIECLYDGPYIELFARNTRSGWDSWGNQVEKFGETSNV